MSSRTLVEGQGQGRHDRAGRATERGPAGGADLASRLQRLLLRGVRGVAPRVLVGRALPLDNALAHGLRDGAVAAIDGADRTIGGIVELTGRERPQLGHSGALAPA